MFPEEGAPAGNNQHGDGEPVFRCPVPPRGHPQRRGVRHTPQQTQRGPGTDTPMIYVKKNI